MESLLKKLLAAVLVVLLPTFTFAQTATAPTINMFSTSFNFGPVAVSVQMTNPIQAQGVVWNTLHIDVRDDTQTPLMHATLDAVGQAADAATLFGGFLPATNIIQNDLAAGLTLSQAEADAKAKTGVTITSFHDVSLAEYGLILSLIAVICLSSVTVVSPPLSSQASVISSKMETSLAAVGGSDLSTLVTTMQTSFTAVGGGSTIP